MFSHAAVAQTACQQIGTVQISEINELCNVKKKPPARKTFASYYRNILCSYATKGHTDNKC